MSRNESLTAAEIEFILRHRDYKTEEIARLVSRQFKTRRTAKSVGSVLYRFGVRKPRPERARAPTIDQRILSVYPPTGA